MWQAIKSTVLWNYGRTTWQYDVICILILAFIFLTPKAWFEGKERDPLPPENQQITRLIVAPENFSSEFDENAHLQRIRELSGNPDANIVGWRQKTDAGGRTIAYEIDVR